MLILHSTSRCDVCLLEYTWENSARVPHAIACGHIFCRDCLYATTPPLCPLCRKHYQPAKIKRLHVDRPENVDEAREEELRRKQLDLLEQLVEVWDVELKEGLGQTSSTTATTDGHHSAQPSRSGSQEALVPVNGAVQVEEETDEEVSERQPATSRERRVRILSSAQMVSTSDDDEPREQSEDEVYHDFPTEAHEDPAPGVESILDGLAGEHGAGRRFLDRWNPQPALAEGGPSMSVREVQKRYMAEILREVDVWLDRQDSDACIPLRRTRVFFTQHLAVRIALGQALETAKLLTDDRKKLTEDKEEMERLKVEERKTAREELERYVHYVEKLSKENQDLRSRLTKQQDVLPLSERPLLQTHVSTPAMRNPLPPPPQPVSTQYLPSFLQAVSETSGTAPNSSYMGSQYSSHYTPSFAGTSSTSVRFADLAPDSPPRVKERYADLENHTYGSPNGRSGKKKSRSRDPPSTYSYTYNDGQGYFDGTGHHRQSSSTSTAQPFYPSNPLYPTSAPATSGGYTPTHAPPKSLTGSGPAIHSTRPSNSTLPHTTNSAHASPYNSRPTSPYNPHAHNTVPQTSSHAYATRSAGLQTRLDDTSQPLDAFSITSAYLREYSSGFVNGQEAALGLGRFAPPPPPPQGPTTIPRHRREDTSDSLIFTAESAEDGGLFDERDEASLSSRSSSGSRGASQQASGVRNPILASGLGTQPPAGRQIGSVPLPPTSHGHPSPAVSYASGPRSRLIRRDSDNTSANGLGLNSARSGPPSSASSELSAPASLPQDPDAAAAVINQRINAAQYGTSGRRSPSSRSQSSWGTVNSNAQSGSLISGLGWFRTEDNGSVRTRGTRISVTSFGSIANGADGSGGLGSVEELREGDSPRDPRRNSRGSDLGNALSPTTGRESSPVRPVTSMAGVLPVEEQDSDAPSPSQHRATSSSNTHPANSARSGSYYSSSRPSAAAMDRRVASNSTVTPRSAGYTNANQTQPQSLPRQPSQSSLQQTEAQRIAASVGWHSSTSTLNLAASPMSGYYTEVERAPAISRRHGRHREERPNREERVDRRDQPQTYRSQTSMGHAPSAGSASGWMWDSDSNAYPSPFSQASSINDRSSNQLPSTPLQPQPRNTQPFSTSNSGPYSNRPHRETRERDRERERSSYPRTDNHTNQHVPTRPSLLSSDSTSPFPVTVESTDDERSSRGTRPSHAHTSSQNSGGGGRSTRTAGYSSSSSTTLSSTNRADDTPHNAPLQSFGNALGLDLLTASAGISAPAPVSIAHTQQFLRSWSQGD